MKRIFILMVLAILITGCKFRHIDTTQPPKTASITSITAQLPPFTKVNVIGKIDVILHTGATTNKIVLTGDTRDIKETLRTVKDNELYVQINKPYPKYANLKVEIYLKRISCFSYHGYGTIKARGIQTNCLDLVIDNAKDTTINGSLCLCNVKILGPGITQINGIRTGCTTNLYLASFANVKLVGYANLAHIKMSGNSQLSLFWVKSKTLRIKMKDKARAQLAGISDYLHVELWGKAKFDGKYLRSKNSFIKTHDNSTAEISVIKNQHTLAKGKSNIYYYSLPETKTDFLAEEGSVLDFRDLSNPFLKSNSKYNK